MQNCTLPVIFFHGEKDSIVPCEMAQNLYSACTGKKSLTIFKDADHGVCYLANPQLYIKKMQEFFKD